MVKIETADRKIALLKEKRSFLFVQYKLSLSNTNTNQTDPIQKQTKLNQHRYKQTHPITWRIFSLQYGGLFPPTYATTAHGAIHNHVFAPDRCFYIAKQKQQQTRSEPKSPKMTNTKKKAISQISTPANFTFPQQIQKKTHYHHHHHSKLTFSLASVQFVPTNLWLCRPKPFLGWDHLCHRKVSHSTHAALPFPLCPANLSAGPCTCTEEQKNTPY